MENQNQQLISYIQQALAAGQMPETIRAQLLTAGWQPVVVDPTMRAVIGHPSTGPVLARTSPVRKKPTKKMLGIAGGATVVVGGLIIGLIVLLQPKATNNLAQTSLQQNQINNSRQADASNILAAVKNYISNSEGDLPTKIQAGGTTRIVNVCGNDCSDTSTTTTVNLSFYTAQNILLKKYAVSVGPSNANQLLVVTDAGCQATSLTSAPDPSIAIAYIASVSGKNQQVCIGQ